MGNEWATMDTVLPEKDLHIGGTVQRATGLTFWLYGGRPQSVSYEEWEAYTTARWERIFGREANHAKP